MNSGFYIFIFQRSRAFFERWGGGAPTINTVLVRNIAWDSLSDDYLLIGGY